ncbi:MAG: hypothetical protein AAF078_01035 [Planctomycetota bacterium]
MVVSLGVCAALASLHPAHVTAEPATLIINAHLYELPPEADIASLYEHLTGPEAVVGPVSAEPPESFDGLKAHKLGHDVTDTLAWRVRVQARDGDRTYEFQPLGGDYAMTSASDGNHTITVMPHPEHTQVNLADVGSNSPHRAPVAMTGERWERIVAKWQEAFAAGDGPVKDLEIDEATGRVVRRLTSTNYEGFESEARLVYDSPDASRDDVPGSMPRIQLSRYGRLSEGQVGGAQVSYTMGYYELTPVALETALDAIFRIEGDVTLVDSRGKGEGERPYVRRMPMPPAGLAVWEFAEASLNLQAEEQAQREHYASLSANVAGQNIRTLPDGRGTRYATVALIAFGVLAIGAGVFIKVRSS